AQLDVRWSTLRDGTDLYGIAGQARWGADPRLALTMRTEGVRASRLAELALLPVPVDGRVEGALRVTGTPQRPRVDGDVRLLRGAVAGQRVDEARARFVWQSGRLHLQEATGRANSSTLRLAGTVDERGGLRLSLLADRIRLEEIGALANPYLRVRGDVSLEGSLTGTVGDPVIDARVNSSRIVLNGQVFDGVDGRARWRSGVLSLLPLRLHQGRSTYVAEGWLRPVGTPTAQLSLDVRDGRLATLLAISDSPLDMDGLLEGRLALSGPLANPRAELNLSMRDGHYNRYPIRSAIGRLVLSDRRITIRDLEVVPKQGRLRAEGFVDLDGASEIEIGGEGLEVDALRPVLRLRHPLAGTMDFTLQMSGPLSEPVVGLSLQAAEFGVGAPAVDRVLGQVFYREGTINIQQILLEAHGQRARIEGQIPARADRLSLDPTRPLSLRLSADGTDLSLLRLLTPSVEEATGTLEFQVDVTGTTAEPAMAGFARVRSGGLRIGGLNQPIEDLQLDLRFDQSRAVLERLHADVGGGRLAANGQVTFRDLRPDAADLRMGATGIRIEVPPVYRGRVDGEIRLDGPLSALRLSGRITLGAGELLLALPAATTSANRAAFPLSFALDLVAGDDLFVVAGPVRLGVSGQLRLGGTLARPTLAGTVSAGAGEFHAFGTTFVLEEGTATFQEFRGVEPMITARARTRVGDTTVFVHIRGTPGDMQLSLSSDPPLPHDRIVALLAAQTGISQALEGNVEALLRQQLTRLLFGEFEARLRQALGLSELRIEYDFESPLRLRLGQLLVENLYLTLTTIFDAQTRFIWALEYRFSPSVALAFTYDQRGLWLLLLRARFAW
ncbi:MAG: translocation/assembly module TamB domain-containing protein, partial [Armatimonadota bacterium]|nr:translocation/assembly module TamB domain-containing protein [Armatimonadota bacterium]